MTARARAELAYHIATGGTLPADPDAVTWALACLSTAHVSSAQRRAAEVVAEYLDDVVTDADTRSRLGLDDLAWTVEDGWLWLTHEGATVARVCDFGWAVWMPGESQDFAGDAESGTAGMDAAEAALRRAGVLAEGVTVRRPGGVA